MAQHYRMEVWGESNIPSSPGQISMFSDEVWVLLALDYVGSLGCIVLVLNSRVKLEVVLVPDPSGWVVVGNVLLPGGPLRELSLLPLLLLLEFVYGSGSLNSARLERRIALLSLLLKLSSSKWGRFGGIRARSRSLNVVRCLWGQRHFFPSRYSGAIICVQIFSVGIMWFLIHKILISFFSFLFVIFFFFN